MGNETGFKTLKMLPEPVKRNAWNHGSVKESRAGLILKAGSLQYSSTLEA